MSASRLTLLALIACVLVGGAATTSADPIDPAHLAYETHKAEQYKTIPIRKNRRKTPRALITLGPSEVGPFQAGDIVWAQGEYEVTVCLKAGVEFPQSPCPGKLYAYNPKLTGQLVLSPSQAPKDPLAIPISRRRGLHCYQRVPNRNRHCLLTVPPGKERLDAPCDPCYLHLIVSASHQKSRKGHKVTIGSFDDRLSIHQNRAGLSMLRLRGVPKPKPEVTTKALRPVKVRPENEEGDRLTVYSIPIARPRAGDTYWVESKYVARVAHLPYSVAMRNELFLGRHKRSNDPKGAYGPTEYPVVSPRNGWTCTRGPSGHQSPCVIQKGGVLRFDRSSNETFHLNLTVGASASLLDKQHYRGGRVRLGNGYLRIYEFDNTI